jgi:hypothetical protein
VKPTEQIAKSTVVSMTGSLVTTLRALLRNEETSAPSGKADGNRASSSITRLSRRSSLALPSTLSLLAALFAIFVSPALALTGYAPAVPPSFGTPCSTEPCGADQLKEPTGVAVNDSAAPEPSAGDVYIVDKGDNRVKVFNAEGSSLSQFNGAETPAGSFSAPEAIAVDSGILSSSHDDVYVVDTGHDVVDKFEEEAPGKWKYVGQLKESPAGPFAGVAGVTVDSDGNVWVLEYEGGKVDEFSSGGSYVGGFEDGYGHAHAIAAEPNGSLIIARGESPGGEVEVWSETAGTWSPTPFANVGSTALAVDPQTENILIDQGADVELRDSAGLIQTFPSEGLSESYGVAVSASSTAYVTQRAANDVEIFAYGALHASVLRTTISSVGSTEATINARIEAFGEQTAYRVEYGTTAAYSSSTEYDSVGDPRVAAPVQETLTGLQPGTLYHFRFVARNALGGTLGPDMTFTTARATSTGPTLPDNRAYELVSSSGDPGEVYVPDGPAGKSEEDSITEFPFQAAANGNSVAYIGDPGPIGGNGLTGSGLGSEYLSTRDPRLGWIPQAITPQAAGSEEGEHGTEFQGFSSNLEFGVLGAGAAHFAASTEPKGPPSCEGLYNRNPAGSYRPLFTSNKTFCGTLPLQANSLTSPNQELVFAGANSGTEAVPDYSQLLFQTPVALTPGTAPSPEGGGSNLYISAASVIDPINVLPNAQPAPNATFGAPSVQQTHRFDLSNVISADGSRVFWTDLDTTQIYVRENPTAPQSPLGVDDECLVVADACTTAVSGGAAKYWTATAGGGYVFYTEHEELWRFDTETHTRESLVREGKNGEGAGVEGVVGASEDGSYLYFIAEAALAPGAEDRKCAEALEEGTEETPQRERENEEEISGHLPAGKGCNLYLLREGSQPTFVAALAAKDDKLERFVNPVPAPLGAWQPDMGSRTAEVTPDGHSLVFESTQQLTGYDNAAVREGEAEKGIEVFAFRAEGAGRQLSCASCNASGEAPEPRSPGEEVTELPISLNSQYMRRWISDDGTRVFFDTSEPLVSQDTNHAGDVYEWEQEGTIGCPASTSIYGGCVFDLSGGHSTYRSYFIDASASGDDVFFTHRGQLDGLGSPNGKNDLFDARVGGGFSQSSEGCTGTGCQGVPPAPPVFATPSSVTFSGVGNFPPPAVIKPKQKSSKCAKGKRLSRGKCVKVKVKSKKKKAKTKKAKRAKKANSYRGAR